MKAKIFWVNICKILELCAIPAVAIGFGALLGMSMVLGQNKVEALSDAINLSAWLISFIAFQTLVFARLLGCLICVIIDSIRDKHPIRNQDKNDYKTTRSIQIYNILPEEDKVKMDALENLLYETYLAAHPAKSKKKFSLNFGAKHND
jgi:hypothetical protein